MTLNAFNQSSLADFFASKEAYKKINQLIKKNVDHKGTARFFNMFNQCHFPKKTQFVCKDGVVGSVFDDLFDEEQFIKIAEFLKPWRKGPFSFGDLLIDSEWQSQLKWNRFQHVLNLTNKTVLDVGCGNGYYLYRALEQQARFVLGVDPHCLYWYQYLFVSQLLQQDRVGFLPLGWQDCDALKPVFDYVLCLGVLYHQRDPLALLSSLKRVLADDGRVVIETLVLDGHEERYLQPVDRYACMKNVFFIPTIPLLKTWLNNIGFRCIEVIDQSYTTPIEQRSTRWSSDHSLINFLDPLDQSKTLEGYPAPLRVVLMASA